MPLDINQLTQSQLLQLVNHTPVGQILDRAKVRRQMDMAAYRIGDGQHINLVRYIAWLAREWEKPRNGVGATGRALYNGNNVVRQRSRTRSSGEFQITQ